MKQGFHRSLSSRRSLEKISVISKIVVTLWEYVCFTQTISAGIDYIESLAFLDKSSPENITNLRFWLSACNT